MCMLLIVNRPARVIYLQDRVTNTVAVAITGRSGAIFEHQTRLVVYYRFSRSRTVRFLAVWPWLALYST